jgi:hypothetical protein
MQRMIDRSTAALRTTISTIYRSDLSMPGTFHCKGMPNLFAQETADASGEKPRQCGFA